jgi:PKD repeat protein
VTFLKSHAVPVAAFALAAMALGGCTVDKTEQPPLAGPSETGLSLATSVTPDVLDWDGVSRSAVRVTARGPDGRPSSAVPLRVDITLNGVIMDFGTLSSRTAVTDSNGNAEVTYTAPPAPPEAVDNFTTVRLVITPVNGDFHGASSRYVDVRLVPRGVILPPNGNPTAVFTISPASVTTGMSVIFDASGSFDEGLPCGARCAYAWDFGDGSSGTGMVVTHSFSSPNTFLVRLTVTDARGAISNRAQAVTVEASPAPTAEFEFSPTSPRAGQDIFFNAQKSKAAPGHSLVSYDWDFGSGRTGTGVTVTKRYDTPATYNVTLSVTDDTFSPTGTAVTSKPVTVSP